MTNWEHKDIWKRAGKDFVVEVSRHEVPARDGDGPHRWCVYVYVYPEHRLFARIESESLSDDGAALFAFHGGCTFNRWHKRGDVVTAKQIGCDYNHLYDDYYTHMATADDARSVFVDADTIFAHMSPVAEGVES